jgi:hypothetical protein
MYQEYRSIFRSDYARCDLSDALHNSFNIIFNRMMGILLTYRFQKDQDGQTTCGGSSPT